MRESLQLITNDVDIDVDSDTPLSVIQSREGGFFVARALQCCFGFKFTGSADEISSLEYFAFCKAVGKELSVNLFMAAVELLVEHSRDPITVFLVGQVVRAWRHEALGA